MSYCQFRNTQPDFADCQEALEALVRDSGRPLSPEELAAAKRLVHGCLQVLTLIADYHTDGVLEDLDEDKISEALDDMNAVAARSREGGE